MTLPYPDLSLDRRIDTLRRVEALLFKSRRKVAVALGLRWRQGALVTGQFHAVPGSETVADRLAFRQRDADGRWRLVTLRAPGSGDLSVTLESLEVCVGDWQATCPEIPAAVAHGVAA